MPEYLLDYMAVELRTPSYDENYSLKTKRALIQGVPPVLYADGDAGAVNRIIETIFETGISKNGSSMAESHTTSK